MQSSPVTNRRLCGLAAFFVCAIQTALFGQQAAQDTLPATGGAPATYESAPVYPLPAPPLPEAPDGPAAAADIAADQSAVSSELIESEIASADQGFPFGYNLTQGSTSWLIGDGDRFGDFSLQSFPVLSPGEGTGIVAGMGFHFLGGPVQTDLPPRLFDFQIGFQQRKWASDTVGYDVLAVVGAFSDFEGSARKGVRFPGHAVGYYRWSSQTDLVLGVESFDRDDISVLPVVGAIFTPRDDLRLELVFPRPRVEVRINPTCSVYLGGELGGGTWAIERTTRTNDVVTYRDLRLLLGIAHWGRDGKQSAFEIGYVFGRDLSYASRVGDYAPSDTVVIQMTNRF